MLTVKNDHQFGVDVPANKFNISPLVIGEMGDKMADLRISIIKDGQTLASEVVLQPSDGDVTAAIARVAAEARRKIAPKSLWPCTIDIRQTP
jgi:hypothetical protein